MKTPSLLVVVSVILVACAVPPQQVAETQHRLPTDAEVEQYNASVDPDDRIVCRDETRVGTNIPERVCRLVRDVEETSTFHREQLRNILR